MQLDRHLQAARDLIVAEEGCHLHAYPDARSELGKRLVAEHGGAILDRIGHGKAQVDPDLKHLDGKPWTIGYGYAGAEIRPGMVWTKAKADEMLLVSLLAFDKRVNVAWPGAANLHPLARAALISLAYNRGVGMARDPKDPKDRRREMRELRPAVLAADYLRMAELIESMTRLWAAERMGGLLRRRRKEALLCRQAAGEVAGVVA